MAGRRGNAEGTIYQKQTKRKNKDGTEFIYKHWEAQITTGYYPNGKLRRKCISGTTRREVADKLKVLLAEQQRDELIDKDNVLFKDYLERYLNDHKKIKLRQTTFEKYESLARNHIYPSLGSKKLQDIGITFPFFNLMSQNQPLQHCTIAVRKSHHIRISILRNQPHRSALFCLQNQSRSIVNKKLALL